MPPPSRSSRPTLATLAFVLLSLALAWFLGGGGGGGGGDGGEIAASRVRGLLAQTFHYFSRPDTGDLSVPGLAAALQASPAAWLGADLAQRPEEWRHELSADEVAEAKAAVAHAAAALEARSGSGGTLASLRKEDFPLPVRWAPLLWRWRRDLSGVRGRGFVVIRGVPLDAWTDAHAEIFWWGLGE
jgi:hypothetical protein